MANDDRAEALLGEITELYAIVLRIARSSHDGDANMTATQRLALMEIVATGPIRLKMLALRLDTSLPTLSRAVDVLEGLGFVTKRVVSDDHRGVLISPTRRGTSWSARRRALLYDALSRLPKHSKPKRLVEDLSYLNQALRNETGHNELARS